MLEQLIQKYLKDNNLSGESGRDYDLKNDGQGAYIEYWNLDIPEPEFTKEDHDNAPLEQLKEEKISQLKRNRDDSLEAPMDSIKAFEYGTDNEVYFEFRTKSTGNSLTEPATIIFRALSYPSVKYSCNIIEGESKRSGYVEITKDVAENLSSHLQLRAIVNIQHTNDLEEEINSINLNDFDSLEDAIEEINNINIEF